MTIPPPPHLWALDAWKSRKSASVLLCFYSFFFKWQYRLPHLWALNVWKSRKGAPILLCLWVKWPRFYWINEVSQKYSKQSNLAKFHKQINKQAYLIAYPPVRVWTLKENLYDWDFPKLGNRIFGYNIIQSFSVFILRRALNSIRHNSLGSFYRSQYERTQ